MKYNIEPLIIPHERRKEINDKCLFVIDNNLDVLTQNDVFNCYSGDGGLHGLEYKNFDNYYEYSKEKKEIEQGAFFTPHHICKFIKPEYALEFAKKYLGYIEMTEQEREEYKKKCRY